MKKLQRIGVLVFPFALLLSTFAYSQQPPFVNARAQARSAAGGLEREFRSLVNSQTDPAWIGYAVPMIAGEHHMCCYDSAHSVRISGGCCGGCSLESKGASTASAHETGRVELERPASLIVLFRIQQRAVEKIRMFSDDCHLDAGGLAVFWFTEVRPSESVELLSSIVDLENPHSAIPSTQSEIRKPKLHESAVAAIAFHADPAADTALERFVAPNQPEELRKRVAFWLGVARGRRGYEILRRLVHEDKSDQVREGAIFALSQSKEPEAVNTMIETARNDESSHVRGQALFWLAQKAGKKAIGAISEAIEKDPETEVKRRAVFALSQLPADEGVPKLIEVARNNRNAAVRKQAIFWLGQSKDPRALAFFEEILK
ncbi:MAG TPA: HEAT repeat domain-containing protein [Acidobacteriota bacterium]|jgi:hypothetical protein